MTDARTLLRVPPAAPLAVAGTLLLLAASLVGCGDNGDSGLVGPERCAAGETLVRGECRPEGGGRTDAGDDATAEDTTPGSDVVAIDLGGGVDLGGSTDAGLCSPDSRRCNDLGVPQRCEAGAWVDQPVCTGSEVCTDGRCGAGAGCEPGFVLGCADGTSRRVCNADGTNYEAIACDEGLFCFRGSCGTQICEPDTLGCDETGRYVLLCAPSGEELVRSAECSPRDNLACVAGECVSGCAAALKNPTYIGCEYWTVDLPQFEDPFGDPRVVPHAVVLSNTGERAADITIDTRGDVPVSTAAVSIAPGAVETIIFPRADVENTSRSQRSFRISASEPVVAYQFNPLNNVGVASNDASLLLPASAIGREYYVMSWPSGIVTPFAPTAQTGWFTVVATREGETRVSITFTSDVFDTAGTALLSTPADMRGIRRGETRTFRMQQYEVLNFEAKSAFTSIGDLTGSHIEADRPIVVFGGHEEAVLGEGGVGPDGQQESACCADHLEEQLFPVETWGLRYLAVHSPPRGNEVDYWRVLAARDGTRITTNPSIPDLDGRTLNAGEFAEITTTQSFEIAGSQPIMVGQYLVSQQDQGITRTTGDPSFILAVPAEQFRTDYAILVPRSYDQDWITVIRPAGAQIRVDGAAMPDGDFRSFGSGLYEYAYRAMSPGPHLFDAPDGDAFGIVGIGYDGAVSYGYPGGMNLATEFSAIEP